MERKTTTNEQAGAQRYALKDTTAGYIACVHECDRITERLCEIVQEECTAGLEPGSAEYNDALLRVDDRLSAYVEAMTRAQEAIVGLLTGSVTQTLLADRPANSDRILI